jgi:hypothetical protein
MDLSATDRQTFEEIKKIAKSEFNLKYSHHIYEDDLLSIIFRDTKEVMIVECDLKIVLDTAYRSIALMGRLPQPVPQSKVSDLYEALNEVNYKVARIKALLQNPDRKVEVRAELDLFQDAFSPYNFEMVLGRFLVAGSVLFQVVERFIKGQAEKDEILKALYTLNNFQSKNRQGRPGDFPYPS